MARQDATGKKGAHAQATGQGVCIICGEACTGNPAALEFPIKAMRSLRSALKQPARHTVVCSAHRQEAFLLREKFEKRQRDYSAGAIIFFAIAAGGGFFLGRGDLGLFVPALIGALIIAALPFLYYFPKFEK